MNKSIESFGWFVADSIKNNDLEACEKYILPNTSSNWNKLFSDKEFNPESLSISKTEVEEGKIYTDLSGKMISQDQWQKLYDKTFNELLAKTDYLVKTQAQ